MKLNGDMVDKALKSIVYEAKIDAINEFSDRIKRCILERDDETIDCITKKMLEELK